MEKMAEKSEGERELEKTFLQENEQTLGNIYGNIVKNPMVNQDSKNIQNALAYLNMARNELEGEVTDIEYEEGKGDE